MSKGTITLVIALVCLFASSGVNRILIGSRADAGVTDFEPGSELTPGEFVGQVAAGPVRVIPIMLLIAQTMDAFKKQEWHRVLTINRILSQLVPRVPAVWMLNGWNMAVNVSYSHYIAGEPERAYEWILAGLDHLKRGADRNPRDPEIRFYYGQMLWRTLDAQTKSQDALDYYRRRFHADGRNPQLECLAEVDKACELAPFDYRYRVFAVQVRQEIARGIQDHDPARAHRLLTEAVPDVDHIDEIVTRIRDDEQTPRENKAALDALLENLAERKALLLAEIESLRQVSGGLEPSDSRER